MDRSLNGAKPMFSFLCSAYRTKEYLPGTIDSLLAQSVPDWELVVVDNGMDSVIAEIVSRYASMDRRVRLLRQDNQGLIGGVNAAAAVASGRYFVILNSDDQLLPEYCSRMAELLRPRPHVDALSCDSLLYLNEGGYDSPQTHLDTLSIDWRPSVDDPWGHRDLFRGAYLHYTAAVRREVWYAIGGLRPGSDKVEDTDLWLRLLSAGYTVRMTADVLARYRVRDDSDSKSVGEVDKFEGAREALLLEAVRRWGSAEDKQHLDSTLRRQRYHSALRRARVAFRAQDVPTARVEAREALRQMCTARSLVVVVGLGMAPRLLQHVHRARSAMRLTKGRIQARIRPPSNNRSPHQVPANSEIDPDGWLVRRMGRSRR